MLPPATFWWNAITTAADVVTFCTIGNTQTNGFILPLGGFMRPRFPIIVAFRGVGNEPAERLAAADPYGAVLYGRTAA
jgi:hypothetical protein